MAVLDRVATLVRANLNDLIDRAEDPEKMIKQVILDMENQLLQVKTQVAISMADHHLLQKKQAEHEDKAAEWMRKAELAVDKGQDDLARAALERYQSFTKLAEGYTHQVEDQKQQVDTLRKALEQLDQKLGEARGKSDMLLAQASPRARAREGQRRAAGDRRPRPGRRLRSDGAEGPAQRSRQPGQVRAGGRRRGPAVRRADEGRRGRPAARRAQGAAASRVIRRIENRTRGPGSRLRARIPAPSQPSLAFGELRQGRLRRPRTASNPPATSVSPQHGERREVDGKPRFQAQSSLCPLMSLLHSTMLPPCLCCGGGEENGY